MRVNGVDSANAGADGESKPPAFQIIVLGAGGGPNEDNVTGILVRSTATNWAKGSVLAVDAGTHLAAIIRIFQESLPESIPVASSFESSVSIASNRAVRRASSLHAGVSITRRSNSLAEHNGHGQATPLQHTGAINPSPRLLTTGPFADLEVPFESVKGNAAYFMRNLISTYLITHPHLDHISGFAINTASFQHTSRPKRIAALPSTIDAIKTHIFNDVIWPNMSDEDGGVGFVSYMRLVEGGNIQFGDGESRGYIEVCDGLAAKCWSVSHGQCMRKHRSHGSGSGSTHEAFNEAMSRRPSQHAATPTNLQHSQSHGHPPDMMRPIDSSAFFLRDDHTGYEVLIFGDVEPDSLSLSPRNSQVWSDAASKINAGVLTGVLIECSYEDSQSDETLFGHLAPRHLIAELRDLAEKVKALKPREQEPSQRKRKRFSNGAHMREGLETRSRTGRTTSQSGRKTRRQTVSPATPVSLVSEDSVPHEAARAAKEPKVNVPHSIHETAQGSGNMSGPWGYRPLEGLQVIIIHVKETLKDGPEPGETILVQLEQAEKAEQLGCNFSISKAGASIWL
ncbi:hypothetical protein HO133_006498 [Letharia lupina]|uniref:Uncharacterized protein n=1 Tax=Letharia lupina TaxID=560253 RepID=A0A8H6C7H1_9LECA|nr:uncharacterized protein HO133_006498 [Letharia lupina]KAF6218086.1 hypothetical protein HO133_006498 [Letharia lupina]